MSRKSGETWGTPVSLTRKGCVNLRRRVAHPSDTGLQQAQKPGGPILARFLRKGGRVPALHVLPSQKFKSPAGQAGLGMLPVGGPPINFYYAGGDKSRGRAVSAESSVPESEPYFRKSSARTCHAILSS